MKKAILCGIKLEETDYQFNEILNETSNLCEACDIKVLQTLTQNSRSLDKNTGFRKGKLEELKTLIDENGVELIVFLNDLSFGILKRIEEYCGVETIDRTTLILDIFSLRAISRKAKIQTEMARLKYNLPRYASYDYQSDRMRGGGFKNRGSGETKASIVKKNIEYQLNILKKELANLKDHNQLINKKRNKTNLKKVALIGYTNAGKSSLMNVLIDDQFNSEKKVFEKDMLFATLDTSIRKIIHNHHQFYLFDTVGFVSNLPHDLIEAFKSTLSVISDADLLINVVDASNPNYQSQIEVTTNTLKDIKSENTPIITVYNKCDLIDNDINDDLFYISAKENHNINKLLDKIISSLYPKEESFEVLIEYKDYALVDILQQTLNKVEFIEHNEKGIKLRLFGTFEQISPYLIYKS